ncbi:hypothetical protein NQ774_20015 [Ochrobactrum sp. BD61]
MTGYVMIYGTPGQLIGDIRPPDAPWVIEAQILAKPGGILGVPQDWSDAACIVSVTGSNAVEVVERLEMTIEQISSQVTDVVNLGFPAERSTRSEKKRRNARKETNL